MMVLHQNAFPQTRQYDTHPAFQQAFKYLRIYTFHLNTQVEYLKFFCRISFANIQLISLFNNKKAINSKNFMLMND